MILFSKDAAIEVDFHYKDFPSLEKLGETADKLKKLRKLEGVVFGVVEVIDGEGGIRMSIQSQLEGRPLVAPITLDKYFDRAFMSALGVSSSQEIVGKRVYCYFNGNDYDAPRAISIKRGD